MNTLKGINNIGDFSFVEVVSDNITAFLDWGLLNVGAFSNINMPTSGVYGGDRSVLRRSTDPRYTAGTVYEGYRGNWIWESGLSYSSQPIKNSGVYVNSTFYPTGSGHYIDYPNGRVIFNSPVASTATVKTEYSHKWIKVASTKDIPNVVETLYRSFRQDETQYTAASGILKTTPQTRLELPAIIVESLSNIDYAPFQLGGWQYVYIDVVFHVIAENDVTAKRIANIISNQNDSTIFLYSPQQMQNANAYPLTPKGSLSTNPTTYAKWIEHSGDGGYRATENIQHGKMRIFDASAQPGNWLNENTYHKTVRWTTEIVARNI